MNREWKRSKKYVFVTSVEGVLLSTLNTIKTRYIICKNRKLMMFSFLSLTWSFFLYECTHLAGKKRDDKISNSDKNTRIRKGGFDFWWGTQNRCFLSSRHWATERKIEGKVEGKPSRPDISCPETIGSIGSSFHTFPPPSFSFTKRGVFLHI